MGGVPRNFHNIDHYQFSRCLENIFMPFLFVVMQACFNNMHQKLSNNTFKIFSNYTICNYKIHMYELDFTHILCFKHHIFL